MALIFGNESDNKLNGTSGDDDIFGEGGDDVLAGNDTLIGGGADLRLRKS
ncbi:hypothetical protein [Mesorhizobium sp. IMUNJ 23232]